MHGKDEALRLIDSFTKTLPIAPPTDESRAETEAAVERLAEITATEQKARQDLLYWLRTEFGVEKLGQKLENFAALDAEAFVEAVRSRCTSGRGRLTPAALKALRNGHAETTVPLRKGRAEAARLERRLSELVNQAYNLSRDEVELLWSTAPPRMPGS